MRLLAASAFCALDSLHGLPVYLCVLLIGLGALAIDLLADLHRGGSVLQVSGTHTTHTTRTTNTTHTTRTTHFANTTRTTLHY